MDLRQWIGLLEQEGELRRVTAEVHWDRELGAVARRVLEKKGPALLFENITGYRRGRCTRLFTGGLGDRRRLALALGFPKDVANSELLQYVREKNRATIPPRIVPTGPVKEVIVRGPSTRTSFPSPDGITSRAGDTSTRSPAS
jgi:UbiD family decarboxylase